MLEDRALASAVPSTVKLLRLTAGDPPRQLTMLIYGAMLQDVVPFMHR